MTDLCVVTSPVPQGDIGKVDYVDGCTLDITTSEGAPVYSHTPRIRGRGNSTWLAAQKPYKVRSLNRSQTPYGFAASRDWALMADYFDQSKIRSSIAFEMARRATGRWAVNSRHVEVTWNGVDRGLYRYSETCDVQVGRVAVREMSASDIAGDALTGPYVLEVDQYFDDPGYRTSRNTPVMYDVPDVVGVPEQEAYIAGWLEAFETTLVTGTEDEFLPLVDIPMAADWVILQEITRNQDGPWAKSCKIWKAQDSDGGKLHIWPPWDFDLSLGLEWDGGQPSPVGPWVLQDPEIGYPSWPWEMYSRSPVFQQAVRHAWDVRWAPTISAMLAEDHIGEIEDEIGAARSRDRAIWRSGALPSHHTASAISTWLGNRADWMESFLPAAVLPAGWSIWDGATSTPATVTIWDGTDEIPATTEIAG